MFREFDDCGILRTCAAHGQEVSGSLAMSTCGVPAFRPRKAGGEHRRGAEESRTGGTMAVDSIFRPEFDRFLVEKGGKILVQVPPDLRDVEWLATACRREERLVDCSCTE